MKMGGGGFRRAPVNEQSSSVIIGDLPDNSHRSGPCLQFPHAHTITAIINEEPLSISQLMQVPPVAPGLASAEVRSDERRSADATYRHRSCYPHC